MNKTGPLWIFIAFCVSLNMTQLVMWKNYKNVCISFLRINYVVDDYHLTTENSNIGRNKNVIVACIRGGT